MDPIEAINRVMRSIHDQFYVETRSPREFNRDYVPLRKAVMRFAYEFSQRGWELTEIEFVQAFLKFLPTVKETDHQYLPRFLETCVTRHIGQKAEEYSAAQKKSRMTGKLVDDLKSRMQLKPEDQATRGTEAIAKLYDMAKQMKKRPARKAVKQEPQLTLL